jgi:Putative prokaryotic signal transducing protein
MQPKMTPHNFNFLEAELPAWSEEGEVVAKFFSVIEAELAAARLRSEGVHCFLANTTAQTVLPHLQTVLRLHVRPQDSAMAREILQEAAVDALQTTQVSPSGKGAILVLLVGIALLLVFLLLKSRSF